MHHSTEVARRECAEHAAHLDSLEPAWTELMSHAASTPNVLETCSQEEREKQVKSLLRKFEDLQVIYPQTICDWVKANVCFNGRSLIKLEATQKHGSIPVLVCITLTPIDIQQAKLFSFLDGQRDVLPRFNFLSNEGLLMLLSFANHPKETLPYIRHCFPAISQLGFEFKDGGEYQVLTFFRGSNGERVNLVESVRCDGPVQDWFLQLEAAIQQALKAEFTSIMSSLEEHPAETWITSSALQLAMLCTDVTKTSVIEQALAAAVKHGGGTTMMKGCLSSIQAGLDSLVALVQRQEEMVEDRNKTSQVLFTTLAWRDLAANLVDETSPACFAWQSQLRSYAMGDNDVTVKIANLEFAYGWTYLGAAHVSSIKTSASHALMLAVISVMDMQVGP